jgi:hypothetical protein
MGHYANECPTQEDEQSDGKETVMKGTSNMMIGKDDGNYDGFEIFTFHQSSKHVSPKWILLNNQLTTEIFCDPVLLTNIHDANRSIDIYCNVRRRCVSKIGMRKNYGDVWLSNDAIGDILLLVKERYPIKYDSNNGNHFVVIQTTKQVIFKQIKLRIYYHNTGNREFVLINMVQDNREEYTQQEFDKAKEAIRALGMVGYPSPKDFGNKIDSNMICNYSIPPALYTLLLLK